MLRSGHCRAIKRGVEIDVLAVQPQEEARQAGANAVSPGVARAASGVEALVAIWTSSSSSETCVEAVRTCTAGTSQARGDRGNRRLPAQLELAKAPRLCPRPPLLHRLRSKRWPEGRLTRPSCRTAIARREEHAGQPRHPLRRLPPRGASQTLASLRGSSDRCPDGCSTAPFAEQLSRSNPSDRWRCRPFQRRDGAQTRIRTTW
jgi:hypothetical protein